MSNQCYFTINNLISHNDNELKHIKQTNTITTHLAYHYLVSQHFRYGAFRYKYINFAMYIDKSY